MAEPYVPIAQHTTYAALMTELEVSTDAAEPYTDDLDTAVDNALAHKNTAEALVENKFNILFLVGC
jgi:hypothetical protein